MLGYDKAMNTPAPELAINELLDQADAIFQHGADPTEATLTRMEWQAKKCLRAFPHGAYIVLGLLAARRWDEAGMERAFQSALAHGWTAAWALNYGNTLRWFHRLEDALIQANTVIAQGPGPHWMQALDKAIGWAYALGRFHLASDLIAALRQHTDTLSEHTARLARVLPPLVQAADALTLTDDAMAAMVAPVWRLAHERKMGEKIGVRDDLYNDGDLFLGRTFILPVSSDDILPLYETLIAAHSAQEEPLPIWKFSVGLEAMEKA